jgi:hypothetical protein
VLEMVRTGIVAMRRGKTASAVNAVPDDQDIAGADVSYSV